MARVCVSICLTVHFLFRNASRRWCSFKAIWYLECVAFGEWRWTKHFNDLSTASIRSLIYSCRFYTLFSPIIFLELIKDLQPSFGAWMDLIAIYHWLQHSFCFRFFCIVANIFFCCCQIMMIFRGKEIIYCCVFCRCNGEHHGTVIMGQSAHCISGRYFTNFTLLFTNLTVSILLLYQNQHQQNQLQFARNRSLKINSTDFNTNHPKIIILNGPPIFRNNLLASLTSISGRCTREDERSKYCSHIGSFVGQKLKAILFWHGRKCAIDVIDLTSKREDAS